MEHNRDVYDRYVHEYDEYRLYPPEREFLGRLKSKWAGARMLDIGIGTGRTTSIYSMLVADYVGIDYSEGMLRQCRRVLPERAGVTYRHCDARDLSGFYAQPFDIILFSMNGIDSVNMESRERILCEIRKVLKPDGRFFFSTHSIRAYSKYRPWPDMPLSSLVQSGYRLAKALSKRFNAWRRLGNLDQDKIRTLPSMGLKTGDHDFEIDIFHIDPVLQIEQLKRLGFAVEAVLDPQGREADPASATAEWLYFLCSRAHV